MLIADILLLRKRALIETVNDQLRSINQLEHTRHLKALQFLFYAKKTRSNLGYTFEHLAYLISKTKDKKRIGVCIDICHLFAAGYDFSTKDAYEKVWQLFDRVVGFKYLQGMHLNDSKGALGSKIDRHDFIGNGKIGLEPFKFFMQDPRFDNLPLILETIDHPIFCS